MEPDPPPALVRDDEHVLPVEGPIEMTRAACAGRIARATERRLDSAHATIDNAMDVLLTTFERSRLWPGQRGGR